jgi:transposase
MEEMVTIPLWEYEALKSENATLRNDNQELKDKLALIKGGRDSRTSSTSPSQDIGRSNRSSLRMPSGKKSGGQPGHTGHHLQISNTPDEIVNHTPEFCTCCGKNLEDVFCDSYIRRQEVDLPPILPVYTEHRSHIKICPSCGVKNRGIFPERIVAPIQYGPVVEATTGYLSAYQYLPYRRIVHFFKDCFGLHLSEGCIDGFLNRLSNKTSSTYELIKVSHYTKKETAEKLIFGNSPLWLSSIGFNDLSEGKTLLKYLGIKQTYSYNNYTQFIGCFMFDEDCLNQFRLYGKAANREATGVYLKN